MTAHKATKVKILGFLVSVILLSSPFAQFAFAQGTQTSGGVNVPGSWYTGEGLKKGDYFEYRLCELDLNDCAPVIMKFWIRGDVTKGTETLWDVVTVVEDGSKIVKGTMQVGKVAPEPVSQSEGLFDYSRAFKSSLAWLSAFATADSKDLIHGPKKFSDRAWGKIGAIGGAQLIPKRAETITVPAGTFDTVVVGWYSGNNNEIWILDDFPFPVKALAYAWVTTGIAPVQFEFELLKYQENVQSDPFSGVVSTIDEKAGLGCVTDYRDYTSKQAATNTFSMMIEYAYAPKTPKEGCFIDFKLNFKNKYNTNEFVNQVHYDIWVVDDKGKKIRSYADEIGRNDIFNGFGLAHINFPVKESAGLNHYAIFIYGVGPQNQVPAGDLAGYVLVDINIAKNENLNQPSNGITANIPSWIKKNAGWWADGVTDDKSFVDAIQYLIKEKILTIPPTTPGTSTATSNIPTWIKNNAGWWADGTIDDQAFVSGIQYLVQNGIIRVSPSS